MKNNKKINMKNNKKILLYAFTLTISLFAINSMAANAIKIGAIYDVTGELAEHGSHQANGFQLAIDNINAQGGLLDQRIELTIYDTQSKLNKYRQHAKTAVKKGQLSAVFGGLTSTSREAMRPIFRRANLPYFYSTQYEGGACDRQTFVTGPSASQQLKPLMQWSIKEYGSRIYIMAPAYNFGVISSHWVQEYARQNNAEIVGKEFLPLSVTDYAATIQNIKKAQPDFVVAMPVGPDQMRFLEQFASSGLKEKIGVVSTTLSDVEKISSAAHQGVIVSQAYFTSLNTAENRHFLEAWKKKFGPIDAVSSEAVTAWNAVHLWAQAVKRAGTAEVNAVYQAIETGKITFTGPNGFVSLEPRSHHVRQNIYLAQGNINNGFDLISTFAAVPPIYENSTCDLIANPKLVKHFTPG